MLRRRGWLKVKCDIWIKPSLRKHCLNHNTMGFDQNKDVNGQAQRGSLSQAWGITIAMGKGNEETHLDW